MNGASICKRPGLNPQQTPPLLKKKFYEKFGVEGGVVPQASLHICIFAFFL
jgi:hypothetical protein